MTRFERLENAIFDTSFPCNAIPFARGVADYVREHGTDSVQSDSVKRMLWILMAQSYGQMATIDLCAEWDRLNKSSGERLYENGLMLKEEVKNDDD